MRRPLNRLLASRGLELRELGSHARRYGDGMDALRRRGFSPATVVDVGVGRGTPWLYDPWPSAHLVLIEPHPVFVPDLQRLAATRGATVFTQAVGATAGTVVLNTNDHTPTSSSLLAPSAMSKALARRRPCRITPVPVPMRTLDETLPEATFDGPLLLKIDTEGCERDVILGATHTLRRTEVVITETCVAQRFEGSYEFADLIALMDARGFRLFDVLDIRTLGKRGPINYLDGVFIRRGALATVG